MKKYGLQLRVPPSQQKKTVVRPSAPLAGFRDDEDDDVEKEISRQASKNKSLKDIEEQHKKALAEDPSVFDYDSVYDEMKGQVALPKAQDRQERKPKYIQALLNKAVERQREQDVIYERKLAKERSKDDHLYSDKDKFVTSAYKKKLMEQAKWLEEDRLRQLREEKDDVTKKTDLSDFYFNLEKNVAFGGKSKQSQKLEDLQTLEKNTNKELIGSSDKGTSLSDAKPSLVSPAVKEDEQDEVDEKKEHKDFPPENSTVSHDLHEAVTNSDSTKSSVDPVPEQPNPDHHRRNETAVAAAKERFLARKKAKLQ